MQFSLGCDDYALRQKSDYVPVLWDTDRLVNGHVLIVGKSGTGKSWTLRRFMDQAKLPMRVHLFDVHGDMDIDGANTIRFSEATEFGLNPLKIDDDPHFGGVRKRVQAFVSALNSTSSRVLGPKQEACLRNLLADLYAANGFYADKPESWRLNDGISRRFPKKHPTVDDLYRFTYAKLKQMFLGADCKAVKALDDVNRKTSVMQQKLRKLNNVKDDECEKLENEIASSKTRAIESFTEYLDAIKTGQELDSLLKYDSQDVIKSVADRLENLKSSGICRSQPIQFDEQSTVWRYDIRSYREEEKRLFVAFRLQELFSDAVRRGPVEGVREIIVLDEAHLFFKDDEDSILNTLAKEARKFGIALICASQSPTHFSDDFLSNVATKIILKIDPMYWDGTVRKMRIDSKLLDYLTPHETIAVQMANKGDVRSVFKQVNVKKR